MSEDGVIAAMNKVTEADPLVPRQEKLLISIYNLNYQPGWWIETMVPITRPLTQSFLDLEAQGLLKISDKGRNGPLGLKLDVWIIILTDRGRAMAKMLVG